MKKVKVFSLGLGVLALFMSFVAYASACGLDVQAQLIETATLIGDKYVETAEKLNFPKPVIPIIPMVIPLLTFIVSSVIVMKRVSARKKPMRAYIIGACGSRIDIRFSKTIRLDYCEPYISLGCPRRFDFHALEDEKGRTVKRAAVDFCKECVADYEIRNLQS